MTNFEIISEEFMVQKMAKGLVSGKEFKTVADTAVGKWCIMVKLDDGRVGVGLHEDKNKATELAKEEALG